MEQVSTLRLLKRNPCQLAHHETFAMLNATPWEALGYQGARPPAMWGQIDTKIISTSLAKPCGLMRSQLIILVDC